MVFNLQSYIAAGYSGIMIYGSEDKRIISDISAICKVISNKTGTPFDMRVWTVANGWQDSGDIDLKKEGASTINDIKDALKQMLSFKNSGCYCLVNFHFFIKDPGVIQIVKEIVYKWKNTDEDGDKHLIFIENVLTIPPELEKEITVLDYDLPSRGELESALRSVITDTAGNLRIKELSDAHKDKILSAALGMTYLEAENAFAISLIEKGVIDVAVINREKGQILKKSGLLELFPSTETLDDVGGLDNLKEWVRKRTKAFTPEARAFGITPPRGIILAGVSGSGKSLSAKAIAHALKQPLIRVDIGKSFGSLVGQSEERARMITKQLDAMAPCVPWIDEAEKGFSGTKSGGTTNSDVTMRVLGTFLTWLAETKYPIFCVMTVNNVEILPPELLRKGRFDELFFVDLPNSEERKQIFEIHLRKRGRLVKNFDIEALSKASDGYVGSEIEEAIKSGLFDAFDIGREIVTDDIITAIGKTVPLSKTMEKEVTALRQWAAQRAVKASKPSVDIRAPHRRINSGDSSFRSGINFN